MLPSLSKDDLRDLLPGPEHFFFRRTIWRLYKTKARPNKMDVAQLLDLEIQARSALIDSDVTKEQDRPSKILKAYPCFGDLDHASKCFRFMYNYAS